MNRICRILAALGWVTLGPLPSAQGQSPSFTGLHLAAGLNEPTGNNQAFFRTGYQLVGGLILGLGTHPFTIRIDGVYGRNGGEEEIVGPDVSSNYFGGLVGTQVYFAVRNPAVMPYLVAQVGMTAGKISAPIGESERETDFAIAGGGGVDIRAGSLYGFVEVLYGAAMRDPESETSITARLGIRVRRKR
jgi:hypothetical protein